MKKDTLSRFFLGLIFGGITGIVAYSINMPDAIEGVIRQITSISMLSFTLLIKILIWPLGCLAFIDAFRLMWRMIRGHYGGGDSVRTYIATTVMAVLLSIFVGEMILSRLNEVVEFKPWTDIRSDLLYWEQSLLPYFYRIRLEVICFISAVFGIGLAEYERRRSFDDDLKKDIFKDAYKRLIQLVYKLYFIFPIIIFLISFELTSRTGAAMFKFVFIYAVMVFLLIALHVIFVFSGTIAFKLKLSPLTFFKKSLSLIRIAGWTINSRETEPVTIRTATIKLGVPEGIAKEVILGGTTLNMDGTAIMQTVAILLTASVYGIQFEAFNLWGLSFMLVIIAMVTTAGTITGMFTLGIVYHIFGVPLELLAIIISISHVVSVAVTPVNIMGDLVTAMVVADDFGKLNRDIYNN